MDVIGVFSSCVTAFRKLSCRSLRRTSRTRKMVLRTTPAMSSAKKGMPMSIGTRRRQLRMIQPTLRATAAPSMHAPRTMKKIVLRFRPLILMGASTRRAIKIARSEKCTGRAMELFAAELLSDSCWLRIVRIELRDLDVPCQAEFLEQPDAVVVGIDLVPCQA